MSLTIATTKRPCPMPNRQLTEEGGLTEEAEEAEEELFRQRLEESAPLWHPAYDRPTVLA